MVGTPDKHELIIDMDCLQTWAYMFNRNVDWIHETLDIRYLPEYTRSNVYIILSILLK